MRFTGTGHGTALIRNRPRILGQYLPLLANLNPKWPEQFQNYPQSIVKNPSLLSQVLMSSCLRSWNGGFHYRGRPPCQCLPGINDMLMYCLDCKSEKSGSLFLFSFKTFCYSARLLSEILVHAVRRNSAQCRSLLETPPYFGSRPNRICKLNPQLAKTMPKLPLINSNKP